MKRIGIEINGVLRDTIEKFKQLYEQHMIGKMEFDSVDKTYEITFSGDTEEITELNENVDVNWFEYKLLSDVTSLELDKHFAFPSKDELYSFMYEDYTMELFGHSPSTEINTFNTLNELYLDLRDKYNMLIVSDEIGKSKPASLFFLAKFGCLLEQVFFYSEITKNNMWDNVDLLLTANPNLITNKPNNKIVVKFKTKYNENVKSDYEISTLSEFNLLLNKIEESYV
jgi:hypothetical protein